MANLTEQEIINNAYYILEQDSDGWDTDDDEYLTARGLLNVGVGRWEHYENTVWRELWVKLSDAADGTKTITAGTSDYSCPTNFVRASSWVRTIRNGNSTYWKVIDPSKSSGYSNSTDYVCWYTGNKKDGFTLHFNPNVTLTTADTIEYEYYKGATKTTATTDEVELSDPNFLAYFIAAHMSEDGLDTSLFTIAEQLLDNMQTENMDSLMLIEDSVDDTLEGNTGFGR